MTEEKSSFHLLVTGAVQGVGFRPFVYRCASALGLTGWVKNTAQGVEIIVQGEMERRKEFLRMLKMSLGQPARIDQIQVVEKNCPSCEHFEIQDSLLDAYPKTQLLPDLAMCEECRREIHDSVNRRYQYPFTNCTHCGPRFSIINALPYDRALTTMKDFVMCPQCRAEYENPADRRFHAQPNACWHCGPQVAMLNVRGQQVGLGREVFAMARYVLKRGQILALKGIGGFQLLVDARQTQAVERLRKRKQRPHKPFAVMFPTFDSLTQAVVCSELEEKILKSSAAPIVLLQKRNGTTITNSVAPDNPNLGGMLPYSPLHEVLLSQLSFPVVATSGNVSDEAICIDNEEAIERLGAVADYFLIHNRGIVRQADDSVVRVMAGQPTILRRARGYAPGFFQLPGEPTCDHRGAVLAVGAQQKNTIALSVGSQLLLSQHIGDLDTQETLDTFKATIASWQAMYNQPVTDVVRDLHPDYLSSQFAQSLSAKKMSIQHHYSHVVSCLVEHRLIEDVLGVVWDGTGLGTDGTIWGGEFLQANVRCFSRRAHFKTFPLPGGEKAALEPLRSLAGLLSEIPSIASLPHPDLAVFQAMIERRVNCPQTSSVGRLFDGIAALLGVECHPTFEGQAAMALEFLAEQSNVMKTYPFDFHDGVVDWRPMIEAMVEEVTHYEDKRDIAAKFHQTLVAMILSVVKQENFKTVVLTGGCFQNRVLLNGAVTRLKAEGFTPVWHHEVPPHDGGIALGQLAHYLLR